MRQTKRLLKIASKNAAGAFKGKQGILHSFLFVADLDFWQQCMVTGSALVFVQQGYIRSNKQWFQQCSKHVSELFAGLTLRGLGAWCWLMCSTEYRKLSSWQYWQCLPILFRVDYSTDLALHYYTVRLMMDSLEHKRSNQCSRTRDIFFLVTTHTGPQTVWSEIWVSYASSG